MHLSFTSLQSLLDHNNNVSIIIDINNNIHCPVVSVSFDVADRQFADLSASWLGLMDGANDVKELIPELFYLTELFRNENEFDLGWLQGIHVLYFFISVNNCTVLFSWAILSSMCTVCMLNS